MAKKIKSFQKKKPPSKRRLKSLIHEVIGQSFKEHHDYCQSYRNLENGCDCGIEALNETLRDLLKEVL